MSDLYFFPYLRRGLAHHLSTADPGAGGLGPAELDAGITIAGEAVAQTIGLLAPHRVASLTAGEISRRYPAPDADDVEWNYFPLVEFNAPDMPWRFSPAGPGANGRLRPWLALVVVEADAPDIEYIAEAGPRWGAPGRSGWRSPASGPRGDMGVGSCAVVAAGRPGDRGGRHVPGCTLVEDHLSPTDGARPRISGGIGQRLSRRR